VSNPKHYFICGIGGSGMLPLAIILKNTGFRISGSDRSYDQGRTPEKFRWILEQGITLYPQDGTGVTDVVDAVVISKAVEDTVPDIIAAKVQNIPIRQRAAILTELFNGSKTRIAVSGTSGKTTTTGMIGFILKEAGLSPTVMNGGIFKNYARENPYSTAFVGSGGIFVTEVDESDGADIVKSYSPDIAVIHNITLDHQPMEELRAMFSGFLAKTRIAVINAADEGVANIAKGFAGDIITYGTKRSDLYAEDYKPQPDGCEVAIVSKGAKHRLRLGIPGQHNVSNALAALSAVGAAGVKLETACEILSRFEGIKRRMDVVGTKNNITVIDDFAHNPDKIAATLTTLKEFPGRLLIFFQPHGYGFLKVVGKEVAESFAAHMSTDDKLYMVEPLYMGGTVDKSLGAGDLVTNIVSHGKYAELLPDRERVAEAIVKSAKSGDRIIIMGARDDTLSAYALQFLDKLL